MNSVSTRQACSLPDTCVPFDTHLRAAPGRGRAGSPGAWGWFRYPAHRVDLKLGIDEVRPPTIQATELRRTSLAGRRQPRSGAPVVMLEGHQPSDSRARRGEPRRALARRVGSWMIATVTDPHTAISGWTALVFDIPRMRGSLAVGREATPALGMRDLSC